MSPEAKSVIDWMATGSAVVSVLTNVLPVLIMAMTALWWALRIWESKTVQGWFRKGRERRKG